MSVPTVRSLTARDADDARALVHASLEGTRYLARTLELLETALGGMDPECAGMVRVAERSLDALLMHGPIAGATGVEKLHALVGTDVEALSELVRVLPGTHSARMIICELPRAPAHATAAEVLATNGFTREGSVARFFTEDTALDLLVWRRDDRLP